MAQRNSLKPIAQESDNNMSANLHFIPSSNAKYIWDYLMTFIGNERGVAGLMGNIYYESQCYPYKVYGDNSIPPSSVSLIYTDNYDQHKTGYDMNTFIHDHKPYGLCQWLTSNRKQWLYEGKAHDSQAIRYPSSSYSLGSMIRGVNLIKYELLDVSYYQTDYNTLTQAPDVLDEEQNVAISIVQHYLGLATDDGSYQNRKDLATEIYNSYGNPSQNHVYVEVVGNGTAYVSNPYPLDGEQITLYAYPNQNESIVDITGRASNGQVIALYNDRETQPITYNEQNYGNFINIKVEFTGQTPPTPPTPPTPASIYWRKNHMKIWEYPFLK